MKPRPSRDWFKFWTHAFFGALFGVFVGVEVWIRLGDAQTKSMLVGAGYIVGGAIVVGLIAALRSDSGWDER